MELKRKYFKITLQNVTLNSETAHNLNNILKVIEKHGSIVRQFVVKNADLTHDILLPILQCLLQLEKITLDDVMLKTDGFSVDTLKTDENVLELKYLKQIVWHKADINVGPLIIFIIASILFLLFSCCAFLIHQKFLVLNKRQQLVCLIVLEENT